MADQLIVLAARSICMISNARFNHDQELCLSSHTNDDPTQIIGSLINEFHVRHCDNFDRDITNFTVSSWLETKFKIQNCSSMESRCCR